MDKNIIKERLTEIFRDKLYRDISVYDSVWEESIFGRNIALLPSEAYFLLVEIEKKFGISFSYDMILDGKFSVLNNICNSIIQLQNKDNV